MTLLTLELVLRVSCYNSLPCMLQHAVNVPTKHLCRGGDGSHYSGALQRQQNNTQRRYLGHAAAVESGAPSYAVAAPALRFFSPGSRSASSTARLMASGCSVGSSTSICASGEITIIHNKEGGWEGAPWGPETQAVAALRTSNTS